MNVFNPRDQLEAEPYLAYCRTDRDNCRVYYKCGLQLFAYQLDQRDQYLLFVCTSDGEPSHVIAHRLVDRLPSDDVTFRYWARENKLVA